MKKVFIFHFNPVERYPPTMNLIEYLKQHGFTPIIFTTGSSKSLQTFSQGLIYRAKEIQPNKSAFVKMFYYFYYFGFSFLKCVFQNPKNIIYFETTSSLSPILIKYTLGKRVNLLIHYHEYMTKEEYKRSKVLLFLHWVEKKIYSKASWISHTNISRLNLFKNDENLKDIKSLHVLKNFPPESWICDSPKVMNFTKTLKLVYLGSLSIENFFIKEVVTWIESKGKTITLDIYANDNNGHIKEYLESVNAQNVKVHGYLAYNEIPAVLKNYHVGLILYNNQSPNVIYSESNKFFEYLALGLDIWYPEYIVELNKYNRVNALPRILPLNFNDLENASLDRYYTIASNPSTPFVQSNYAFNFELKKILPYLI